MTRQHAIRVLVVGLVVAAALLASHALVLPVDASWGVNRVLHHLWQGAAGLAAAGGAAYVLWPRPKARRRDIERERMRRRVIALVAVVLGAVLVVVAMELRREVSGRRYVDEAMADGGRIAEAVRLYAEAHGGARPADLQALVPQYLARGALYYVYRDGPAKAPPPPAGADEAPSWSLAHIPTDDKGKPLLHISAYAYLKPGLTWSGRTVIIRGDGQVEMRSDDLAAQLDRAALKAAPAPAENTGTAPPAGPPPTDPAAEGPAAQ